MVSWYDGMPYTPNILDSIATNWELEPEPKKKVKMWQWISKGGVSGYCLTSGFYPDANEAYRNIGYEIIQKAEWTMIEVEVD